MALESGSFISDLNPANPAGTDNRSQGDDHIRLIKSTLKNTFPNVNGAITATDEQLNAVAAAGALAFPGMIVMWSGSVATIPTGWKLCDGVGTISTGAPVPNLVGRFIVGSSTNTGGSYNVGQTGGTANTIVTGSTDGHAITIDQMPSHNHGPLSPATSFLGNGLGAGNTSTGSNIGNIGGTGYTGGNQAHSHGLSINIPNGNLPPYYALAFLIKN